MPRLSWPQVILFLGESLLLIAGAVVLVVLKRDVNVIVTIAGLVILPILGAAGASIYQRVDQKLDRTIENSNGRIAELMDMVKDLQQQNVHLAIQAPPDAILTPPKDE